MANDSYQVGFFVGEILEGTARKYPQKVALISREGEMTFAALNDRVTYLAGHLQSEGVKQGDRVGLLLPNSLFFALSYYATQRMGAVTTVLDARLKGKELIGVLQDADLNLLITHKRLMSQIAEALKECNGIPLWVVDGEGEQSFKNRLSPAPTAFVSPRLSPEDSALILYTSGTTGEPKGVVLNYINLTQFPRCMGEMCHTGADELLVCILPMSHISGPIYCNEIADKGGTMVIFDQINPIILLEGIQRHRITLFHGVPIIFQLLLGVTNLKDYDTRSVEIAAMMGATVPLSLMRAFKMAQPHIKIAQGYGLTETSPLITLTEPDKADTKMASIGKAVPDVEVKIVDERGKELPEGEAGEIITRGPHVMKGYFRRSEATTERIRDGWFYTGDIGRRDSDGYYYHLGRKDDMIITGGLNVYPAEIENLLYEHPQVQEAVVFPIPDDKRGNIIGAAVVLRPGEKIVDKDLLGFLRSNLANFKVPQKIAVRDSLPRTSTGKVIRDASALLSDS
ncbi:MAG: AMP-binding protein [Deltaproteobacteria bacterium]|nr:AMP-binding protein [Deltaproteobacteria bacterium]